MENRRNWKKGYSQTIVARPPRPETGTGSGGATCLEYTAILVVFQRSGQWTHGHGTQPALARRDMHMQLFSLLMSVWLSIAAS